MTCLHKHLKVLMSVLSLGLNLPVYCQSQAGQATDLYKAGRYGPAAVAFESAIKANANDNMSHYYLALCYQQLHQWEAASAQYQWVATNASSADLRNYGARGVEQMRSASAPRTGSSSQGGFVSTGKPQVLAFLCGCNACKILQVSLNNVQSEYKDKVEIQRLRRNAEVEEHYHVKGCPSVVILDKRGNESYSKIGLMSDTEISDRVRHLL